MTIIISWNGRYGPRRLSRMLRGSGQVFQPPRTGGGIMFNSSRPKVNRPLGNAEKTSEFGLGSEVRCNPDDLRVELAGYWSRLLMRVKEQSEVVDSKKVSEEFSS
jgi:hypothetical protein